ncbi:MAG TPA: sigma-70 family RNA polymerase sigma factor [Verrucomicrobiae bacterium]
MDDIGLLREYASHNSEAAFETLVSRWVRLVYSAALRQVHDPHLAQEVMQAVFIILAKKAGKIGDQTILSGWLFKTTRFAAMAQTRAAARRRQREQEAQMQSEIQTNAPDPLWEQLSPLLDEALAQLGEKDRQAVLLRFFENKSLKEVGSSLGTGEDTARMRISRALEKLRRFFLKRGVVSTTAIIAGAISANSVQAIPAGLATTITATVVKGSAVATSILTLVKGTLNIMAWIKTKTVVVISASTLIAGAAVLTLHEQEQKNREQENIIRTEEQQIRTQEQQANLSPEQRIQLEDRLNQLRAQQNQLRAKQDELRAQDTNQDQSREPSSNLFGDPSLQVSPFTMVRFQGGKVLIKYDGADYELAAIDGLSTPTLLDFCRRQYKDQWQKRFAEDLVVDLTQMGHPMNAEHTVSLSLIDPKTGEKKTVERAAMTKKNRQAVWETLHAGERGKPAK